MIPVVGLIFGIILGIASGIILPYGMTTYVAIGILSCVDTMLGGMRAASEKNFQIQVFASGFFLNSLIAVGMVFLGKHLYIDLSIAAIVVFGWRIFNNLSQIRRFVLNKHEKTDMIEK